MEMPGGPARVVARHRSPAPRARLLRKATGRVLEQRGAAPGVLCSASEV